MSLFEIILVVIALALAAVVLVQTKATSLLAWAIVALSVAELLIHGTKLVD